MKKIKEENKKRYVADFETAQDFDDKTYVWAWAVCDCHTLKTEYGTEIKTFFDYLKSLDDQSVIYFHNLKFDQTFILCYLIENGWKQTQERAAKMKNKEFKALTSGVGTAYSLTLCFNKKIITICDSLKKLPFTVDKIAKDLDLSEKKGEIDYYDHREEGSELSEEDKDYIRRDVEIIAKAMKMIFFNNNFYKLTIGSDCMNYYKTNFCKSFKDIFPVLDPRTDKFLREAFNGGICMKLKDSAEEGRTYDFNSMYPSMMKAYCLPFGEPEYYKGEYEKDERYPLYIQRFSAIFELKENHIPTVQIKNDHLFAPNEFIKSSLGLPIELTMTNIDLELFKKQYDIYAIEYLDGYKFHSRRGLFDGYINHFYKMKEEASKTGNKVERQIAKLFLNNIFGKFGTSPVSSYMNYNTQEGVLKRKPVVESKESVYVPVAAFITSYAHRELITAAQLNYDRVCYMDTDSLHLSGDYEPVGLKIHDTALGCWKLESHWTNAKFLRQKTYAECINGKYDFKCAGLPEKCRKNLKIEDFHINAVIPGKLMSKQVKGGTKLVETTFEIKEI